jgi:hypothetical protein
MDKPLSKKKAAEFLKMDVKTFDNYFKSAEEFKCIPRKNDRGRFCFIKEELEAWGADFKCRTVELTFKDYAKCLDFALAMHFRGYVPSDFGTSRQREFGQKITNWVKGQLAEIGVKKFLQKEFGVEIELDFGIHEKIVPQDIIGIIEKGRRREPKVGIGVKASKPKSAYLILGEKEIDLQNRRSDFYILCRPDIPDEHLIRLTKERVVQVVREEQHYPGYKDKMPEFNNIPCEIAGWCSVNELEKVTSIPGQDFTGVRYVKKSGLLHKNKESWLELLKLL